MSADLPEGLDAKVWVEAEGYEGHLYLGYNPHVHHGRIGAWSANLADWTRISKSEIREQSYEAEVWLNAFFIGNEPRPEDMFGIGIYDAPESDSRWQRWRDAVADFRRSGTWPHESWRDLTPFPAGTPLPSFVWTVRGDEVWTWAADAWALADPQPERHFALLEGTCCAERGHHDLTCVTTLHLVCDDCGKTSETIPVEYSTEAWQRERHHYQASLLSDAPETDPDGTGG